MKILILASLVVLALGLSACGEPFQASDFTSLSDAGANAIGSGAGFGGAAGAAGAGVAPDPMASAGSGGKAGEAGASGSGGASPPVLTTYFCSPSKDVTGGYEALNPEPSCLRTKEALNTIGCTHWDNRSILVNGVPATCGVPVDFPVRQDGYTYLTLGAGSGPAAAVRWFLTMPTPTPCAARTWQVGDLYAQGQVMRDACDTASAPVGGEACAVGREYAFSCSGLRCSTIQPGGNDWASTWALVAACG